MKILVIDDKDEELEKARTAVESKGWEALTFNPTSGSRRNSWIKLIETVDAVITDLMWSRNNNPTPDPAGLMVVIHALSLGKQVVVCTNSQEVGGHHGEAMSFIYDGYLVSTYPGPFGWEEGKSWDAAVGSPFR